MSATADERAAIAAAFDVIFASPQVETATGDRATWRTVARRESITPATDEDDARRRPWHRR
jgi:hypothetical protein